MRVLVTGAAGFIGSHLAAACGARGWQVRAVDCLTPYYDVRLKRRNVTLLEGGAGFEHVEADLRVADVDALVSDVDVVLHQAGQPGVRASWADGFDEYVTNNISATQRLLEAARRCGVGRFVFASSSSVYGNAALYPTSEETPPSPTSPYGITKLSAEQLCCVYGTTWGVPTVSLRYFTVYGPGQRPDMAIHRMIDAALAGTTFPLFGDGSKIRDFTYVADVVRANLAAVDGDPPPGSVVNIAGGSQTTVADLVDLVGAVVGRPVRIERRPEAAGDVERTGGAIDQARRLLDWEPEVALAEGVEAQVAWQRELPAASGGSGLDPAEAPVAPAPLRPVT